MCVNAPGPPTGIEEEHEVLLQFLYMAPIGILHARSCGEILMLNPLCAQLLLPLAPGGQIDNLFSALEPVAPRLRGQVQAFVQPHGKVCDAVHVQVPARAGTDRADAAPQVLSLTLLKLDGQRLMAVLADVTQAVQRERALRRSQAWIDNIVTGLPDYAFVALDAEGRIDGWNASIGRVTGFGPQAAVGASYTLLSAPDGAPPSSGAARLRQADGTGWSLSEGWHQRADGTRFWGSCLIAPLPATGGNAGGSSGSTDRPDAATAGGAQTAVAGAEPRAYSLILRNGGAANELGPPPRDAGAPATGHGAARPAALR